MVGFVIQIILDLCLIGCLIYAVMVALRVEKQFAGLRAQRVEMERFVQEFSATVARAEAGIKTLKQVARDSGDDLEKLIERGQAMRDELRFVCDHADQLAEKVTSSTQQLRVPSLSAAPVLATDQRPFLSNEAGGQGEAPQGRSKAERDLLKAVEKLR